MYSRYIRRRRRPRKRELNQTLVERETERIIYKMGWCVFRKANIWSLATKNSSEPTDELICFSLILRARTPLLL